MFFDFPLKDNLIFIPFLGLSVIPGSIFIFCLDAILIVQLLEIVAINNIPSCQEKGSPIQPLIPPPKGK
jgi:hypothetical protein